MLRIKLNEPTTVKGKYVVFLDSTVRKTFSNKRQAHDYVVKLENELNEALLFINEQYVNLMSFYRTYFIADDNYRFKYDTENDLELINNRLNFIASHGQSVNFNTIFSQALNICFDALCAVCDRIEVKSRTRYDMITRRRISLYKKIIIQYRTSFDEFKAQSIFNDNLKTKIA